MKMKPCAIRGDRSGRARAGIVFRWAFLVALVLALLVPGAAFGIHAPSPFQSGTSISHGTSGILDGVIMKPGFDHEAVLESLPTVGIIGLCIIVGVCILAGAFIIMRK